jgi:3-methyladenine DNA glycosylase/8-oxoguanine DNA glycosylase
MREDRDVTDHDRSGAGRRHMLHPPRPVDELLTLRLLRGAGRLRFASDGVWQTTRTVDGPATVLIEPRTGPDQPVVVRAWGTGADRAVAQVPELLGFDDAADDFAPVHPLVLEQHRRHPALRIGRTRSVAEVLLPTIVEQKVPNADAQRSWRALRSAFAEAAPGPADLILPPDPARVAGLAYHDLHRFGIERKRADPLLAACRAAGPLERFAHRTPGQLALGVQQLPGVGPWTASVVARIVLGDPDTVVVGDYNLAAFVAWALVGERTADDARMLDLLEPERPHRARAFALIMTAGLTPPRHGPRLRPASIVDQAR